MSASTIELVIVSQDKVMYKGFVDHVNVTGEAGELGIYPRHIQLLTRLKPGIVSFDVNGEPQVIYTSGGFVEVQPNTVTILADVAIHAKDLDKERILKAKELAESKLSNAKEDDMELVAAKLKREIAKLRAYEYINSMQSKR
ncbi:F0F1 ATP synthase subunit epsilon [Psittacicella gerlachiana]|uniref:ATP synthase epsilon chain n=1 Tax=Psittacicella gerlachiana TaxID=2028574 RepID=A0A3A1YB78_9GAMM|nr:F0F1 ATP synthase subunit epsilon [Psittacicella gerlachiana]RIY33444.1 hypothetical protein CKF59_06390 [Psittacicella gerlachiana]